DNTFSECYSLKEVYIPQNSKLKIITGSAFANTELHELTLPSFEIEISKEAFAKEIYEQVSLKSYVKPNVKAVYSDDTETYKLIWNEIPNAARYEVYQKNNGGYKLIKETTETSLKLNGIKSGKKYTLAVKPIAEIKAQGDGGGYRHYDLPEYYTIAGTMSDDVTVVG
ncbi:MAG: leucine-rich repeat domain-containing protein, partial [Oscillospiraceae bacterium]|nr:leucine-rich repeat domain-containing protein [Oscillospiraceae bacterium]